MEKLVPTSFLEFNPDQLNEVRILNGFQGTKQMCQAIDTLDDWIKKQNHFAVKEFDREYLEHLIIYNKGSVERAKQRLDRTCTFRNLMPEFVCNIDVRNEFQEFRKIVHYCLLPKPTKDNYRFIFQSIIKPDENYDIKKFFRYSYLVTQYLLFTDYCAGIEGIIDLRQFTFGMFSVISFTETHKGLTFLMQSTGTRVKSLHFVVSSKTTDNALTFLKKCLSDKLNKRIHVHSSYESVFKHVDKSILPAEVGGECEKTVKELSDELFNEFCSESYMMRMKYLDTAVTIESKRLNSSFNEEYSGMPGSFKTLCVD